VAGWRPGPQESANGRQGLRSPEDSMREPFSAPGPQRVFRARKILHAAYVRGARTSCLIDRHSGSRGPHSYTMKTSTSCGGGDP